MKDREFDTRTRVGELLDQMYEEGMDVFVFNYELPNGEPVMVRVRIDYDDE